MDVERWTELLAAWNAWHEGEQSAREELARRGHLARGPAAKID